VHIRFSAPIRANIERVESHGVNNTATTSSAGRPGWRYSPPPFSKCFCCVSCIFRFHELAPVRLQAPGSRRALTANRLHPASLRIPACGAPGEQRSLSARMRAPVSTHACAHATRAPADPNGARTLRSCLTPPPHRSSPSWPRLTAIERFC
jgi:hypothetical protein